jgi:hypothetical protein
MINPKEIIEAKQCIKCGTYTPLFMLDNDGYCDDCKPFTQEQNLQEEASQNII